MRIGKGTRAFALSPFAYRFRLCLVGFRDGFFLFWTIVTINAIVETIFDQTPKRIIILSSFTLSPPLLCLYYITQCVICQYFFENYFSFFIIFFSSSGLFFYIRIYTKNFYCVVKRYFPERNCVRGKRSPGFFPAKTKKNSMFRYAKSKISQN